MCPPTRAVKRPSYTFYGSLTLANRGSVFMSFTDAFGDELRREAFAKCPIITHILTDFRRTNKAHHTIAPSIWHRHHDACMTAVVRCDDSP